jgi:hypothetical protein
LTSTWFVTVSRSVPVTMPIMPAVFAVLHLKPRTSMFALALLATA